MPRTYENRRLTRQCILSQSHAALVLALRPLLAVVLLAVLAGGTAVQDVHRALHAAHAAEEATHHDAEHHADHDHDAPSAEAPCAPAPSERDCAVCATQMVASVADGDAVPLASDTSERLTAQARAVRLATASSGARGPPQV